MKQTLERELKLVPGEGFRLPDLGGEPLPTRVFVSTYHDTPDLRLASHGVTFRHRLEDGTGLWQLKLPRGAARIELERAGPPARPPEEMVGLLPALLQGRELVPVARLRTRREGVRALGAEIVEDSVAVLEAQHVRRRFREIEVELIDGDEDALRRLEKALRRAGAKPSGLRPKLFQALDLADPAERAPLRPDATPAEEIGAALREQYEALLRYDPGTRLGIDSEDLHQFRVATRRARAFLRAARPLLDRGWADGLRAELGFLGSALGPARDADVMLEFLRGEVEELGGETAAASGLLGALDVERERAREELLHALSDPRYFTLLDHLEEAERPRLAGGAKQVPLAVLWWKEFRRTRATFAALGPETPDDVLHAARIRVKRARYAAELAANELGDPGRRFVQAAKRLQDVLGEHQDAVVAEERIRAWTPESAEAALVQGRLVERQRARLDTGRAEWPAAWVALEKAARRARP